MKPMADPVPLGTYAEKLRSLETRLDQLELAGAGGDGGGTFGTIEPRLAKLEAQMKAVRAELNKLSLLPADVAGLKECANHLPTRLEAKNDIDAAVDRAGTRTQRTIVIMGSLVAVIVAVLNYISRL